MRHAAQTLVFAGFKVSRRTYGGPFQRLLKASGTPTQTRNLRLLSLFRASPPLRRQASKMAPHPSTGR